MGLWGKFQIQTVDTMVILNQSCERHFQIEKKGGLCVSNMKYLPWARVSELLVNVQLDVEGFGIFSE